MDVLARLNAALSDRYDLERELGAGGMATVYLARDLRHQRRVALKVLRPELGAVIGADRFLAEIRTTAHLQHPHILPLFDSGAADGLLWYAMPYVEGESLRGRLSREKQLPVEQAVRLTKEVASALDYAHRHGIIHRDIKPENILLHDGTALVADFGISLAVTNAGGGRMTETGLSLGTPHYMSPEQAMGERELTARSDVYALGCVCYEMLSGEPPFTGPTAQAIVAKVMTAEPVPLTELRRTVPEGVEAAVLTALQKLPADRFGSAAEFAGALDGTSGGREVGRTRARRVPTALPSSRLPVLLAVTTILAAAWALFATFRPRLAPAQPVVRFSLSLPLDRATVGSSLALSSDGKKLAFVVRGIGSRPSHLALRPMDGLTTTDLAGTEGATSVFWSPDGAWIGFAVGATLRKIRVDGSGATTIATLNSGLLIGDGAWSEDNRILFVIRGFGDLMEVPADGGTPRLLRQPGDSARYLTPSWLPGGKRILVTHQKTATSPHELLVISAETGAALAQLGAGIIARYTPRGFMVWLAADGRLLAQRLDPGSLRLSGEPVVIGEGLSAAGRTILWTVSDNGTLVYAQGNWADHELVIRTAQGPDRLLPIPASYFRGPRFSPDGKRIVVDQEPGGDLVGDVWAFDRTSATFTRLTFEGLSVFPEWTTKGDAIVYSAGLPGRRRYLYRVPADRSGPSTLLMARNVPVFQGILLADERTLIFRENSDSTSRDIYVKSGDSIRPWAVTRFDERSPAVSRDGRQVLYVSNESGHDEVYLRPLDGKGRLAVSVAGGVEPRWGPGDRSAYYRWADTLFSVPILPGPAIGARRVVLVEQYSSTPFHANYDVSPDGAEFVFVRPVHSDAASELMVLLHWFESPTASGKP